MSDAFSMDVLQSPSAAEPENFQKTPLAAELVQTQSNLRLAPIAGRLTPARFAPFDEEFPALIGACGIYDLGWKTHIAVRGEDRLRWLSGMVTNAVQQLQDGEGNYCFLLNAQGRIQGDAFVFREAERVLLSVQADQAAKVLAHLDRFIIMDDVILEDIGEQISSIGLAGPSAIDLLAQFHAEPPALTATGEAAVKSSSLCGMPIHLVTVKTSETLRYEIWSQRTLIPILWNYLVSAGAQPCGLESVEALRILEGTPRYGLDITDRDLPQETSQSRALNFNKGCYLGQEIVERIRSRGAVHRGLRHFQLSGAIPALPADLLAGSSVIGKLTSAVSVPHPNGEIIYAIGIVRTDALTRGEPLTYNEGTAVALDRPPVLLT